MTESQSNVQSCESQMGLAASIFVKEQLYFFTYHFKNMFLNL